MQDDQVLAIVVPCYNEQEVLPQAVAQLKATLVALCDEGLVGKDSFVLLVNDGSTDATWSIMQQLHDADDSICLVNLAGNVGHQNALMAGLNVAKDVCDIAVSIDADLQDDVNAIREMVIKYKAGADIVCGVRRDRKSDTWFKRNSALAFYKIIDRMGVKAIKNHADFRLMSRRALEQLSKYAESNLFLRGIITLIGYKTDIVYYDRKQRIAGTTKYPFTSMMNFAVDGITSFSVRPVRFVFDLGLMFLAITLGVFIYTIWRYCNGETIEGWTSLMISIWFCSGCVLVGIGIMGEYIGKIYTEVKHRPLYNVESVLLNDRLSEKK